MSCGVKWWLFCFWGRSNPVCQVLTIMCSSCMLDSTAFWAGLIILKQHTSTMSSSVHSRPLWVADRVGCGNGVKILPSTGVRCELLSENCLVFKFCFSLCLSLFFSILFSLPIKNQLKHNVLCCPVFLYFSLGTWWWVANSALLCFMFLYLYLGTWVDTCIFWPAFG